MIQLSKQPIGIFGGTFDPIHLGHLQVANEVYKQLNLKEIRFIPCKQSPLKNQSPIASETDRLEMIKLAISDRPYFFTDDREIKRSGVSYTVDTLKSLRKEYPDTPLCFIMSMDSFIQFNLWHKWKEIIQLTHLIITNRNNTNNPANKEILYLLKKCKISEKKSLLNNLVGKIYFLNILPCDISGTKIRILLKNGGNVREMLSPTVLEYIQRYRLYC